MQPLSRPSRLGRLIELAARVAPHERRAVALAFMCNFVLLGSYYILRPVRDTVATVFGVGQLQVLFSVTFVGTLVASPIYALLASRLKLTRLLPGVFWFWFANVLLFERLFASAPQSVAVAAAYYVWFSVANLFMISLFWSLMVDIFTAAQATRLFALIAAGGSIGADRRPVVDAAAGQPPAARRSAAGRSGGFPGRDPAGARLDAREGAPACEPPGGAGDDAGSRIARPPV